MWIMLRQFSHFLLMIKNNLVSTILTSLGIIIASFLFVISINTSTINNNIQSALQDNFPEHTVYIHLGCVTDEILEAYSTKWSKKIEVLENEAKIQGLKNIDCINAVLNGVPQNFLDFPLATDDSSNNLEYNEITNGRNFNFDDYYGYKKVVILKNSYAVGLFHDVNPIGKKLKIGDTSYTIVGTMADTDSTLRELKKPIEKMKVNIYTPNVNFSKIQGYSSYQIIRYDNYDLTNLLLKNKKYENDVTTPSSTSKTVIPVDNGAIIVLVIILVVSVMIINIVMVYNVKERFYEIGIKRAVGASATAIIFQFLFEGFMLGIIGGIIGVAIGYLYTYVIVVIDYIKLGYIVFTPNLVTTIVPICVTALLSVVAAIIPSIIAGKTNIIDCMRVE